MDLRNEIAALKNKLEGYTRAFQTDPQFDFAGMKAVALYQDTDAYTVVRYLDGSATNMLRLWVTKETHAKLVEQFKAYLTSKPAVRKASPDMLSHEMLQNFLFDYFETETAGLQGAVFADWLERKHQNWIKDAEETM